MALISVVICTYNREKYILKAINSIVNQTLDKQKYEIILVDNNSSDNTKIICDHFKKENTEVTFRYVLETNQGLSYARNRGIKESHGDIIVFIDDDAIAEDNFLEDADIFFEKNKDVSCIGGKILLLFETKEPKWINKYMSSLLGYFNPGNIPKPFVNQYPRGSNMFFRKELFNRYGNFNVELGRKGSNLQGAEEKEINLRMRGKEKIIYLPQLVVHHIIPEERTKIDFIKKQAIGTGYSERIRSKSNGTFSRLVSLIKELSKWLVTLFLLGVYLIKFQPAKGKALLYFRFWVTFGMLSKNN